MTGMPRFKIESRTETEPDPDTGEPVPKVLSEHPDYRSARIAQMATGGRLRLIKRE